MIDVEGVSKSYRIGVRASGPDNLKEAVAGAFKRALFRAAPERVSLPATDEIWALRDVSFAVGDGDVLGIIGRNGAGKSTLLKILSRITEPTEGKATLRGRVASLLEVGTGFHAELTGRENVFLSGAILGMSRSEIRERFDEIVSFSEIGRFIDTPVKHYSSGMYVRLAFGVAAHLDPEILIVDEVLAVGDMAFQRKCLGRMEKISRNGRTVLFVSHNLQAVKALCNRGLVLEGGRVVRDSTALEAARYYQESISRADVGVARTGLSVTVRRGEGCVRIERVDVSVDDEPVDGVISMGSRTVFSFTFTVRERVPDLWVFVGFRGGQALNFVTSIQHLVSGTPLDPGNAGKFDVVVPDFPLRPGEYAPYYWLGGGWPLRDYDIIDTKSDFLHVVTDRKYEEIGFDPTLPPDVVGFVNIASQMKGISNC